LLQHVSVYINHHQGSYSLCFAVTILISVIHVVIEVFGAVAAYFVQSRCACISCTVHSASKWFDIINMHGATMKILTEQLL